MGLKTTLVLGASSKKQRYSNKAIRQLVAHKHPVFAYGLKKAEVAGITIRTNFLSFQQIDTVTLYLNPTRQQDFYQKIIDLKPRRVIFNPGTENPVFYKLLDAAGIFHENACTLVLLTTGQY